MILHLIRHGETAENLRRAYLGSGDSPLCRQGEENLRKKREQQAYPQAKLVFSSPLGRCLQSAELLFPGQKPIVIPGLSERDFGEYEGLTHQEIVALPGCRDWGLREDSMEFPGGESWEAFSRRCVEAFLQMVELAEQQEAGSAAVLCHGGTVMAVLQRFAIPRYSRYHWMCGPGCGYTVWWNRAQQALHILDSIPAADDDCQKEHTI